MGNTPPADATTMMVPPPPAADMWRADSRTPCSAAVRSTSMTRRQPRSSSSSRKLPGKIYEVFAFLVVIVLLPFGKDQRAKRELGP